MPKEMLINVSQGEECRIALLEDGRLEELYMERTSATSHVGNIYKGRVTNVEASIQAAFVDFGLGRNGFLHISDLMPTYFGRRGEDIQESVGRKMSRRDRPPIQRCLRRGDEIVVQIIKEGIGTKGPTLSTYLSIPGKILVMMPGMGKMGVSKKIEDEQERRRLRQILDGLKPPKDVAFIIRTAGIGKTKLEIERDLKYLTRLWETLVKKEQEPGPVELYTEGDLVTRTVRDMFSADVGRIVVDNKDVAQRVKEVIKISSPRARNVVDLYENPVPLFHQANIEREIELMYSRYVPLPSGGSLVIDSTEAVVAIDVNSGKFRDHNDAEMTAFKTDMEAADEIPRQLKLRDLGGVIICDFIDLRFERHRRELEERLFENFKNDRAKTKVLRMSQFGIIEITRQRMRPSLKRSIYFDCPHCKGAGLIKTPESLNLDVMRKLAIALDDKRVTRVELSVCPDIAFYLLNTKRAALTELEARTKKSILIRTDAKLSQDELKFELFDVRDFPIILEEIGMSIPERPHTTQLGNRPPGHTAQGRGGRSDNRNNNRKGPSRPLPTRPVDDDDADLEEDRTQLDRDDDYENDHGGDNEPMMDREEDPTDIPAILETEAGDEIAEEYADEERGEGQGEESDHEPEMTAPPQHRDALPGRNAPQPSRNQPPQRVAPGQAQNRQPNQRGENRHGGPVRAQDGGRDQGQGQRPDQRGNQGSNQGNNQASGQGGDEEGQHRRGRRRGRRGRGRGGQGGQGYDQNQGGNQSRGEPNGNFNPNAPRSPQEQFADDVRPDNNRADNNRPDHDRTDEDGYPEIDPGLANDSYADDRTNAPAPMNQRPDSSRSGNDRQGGRPMSRNTGQQNTGQQNTGPKNAGAYDTGEYDTGGSGDEDEETDVESSGEPDSGEPPVRSDGPGLGSDQKPRRRRRRGGRRHRRRNEQGQPIENGTPANQPAAFQPNDQRPEDRADHDGALDDEIESANLDPDRGIENPSGALDSRELKPVAGEHANRFPSASEGITNVDEMRDAAEAADERADESGDEPDAESRSESEVPAKSKGRAKKTTRAKTAAKKTVKKAAPKRIPPKKTTKAVKEDKRSADPTDPVQPTPVVRTGSADKHLISDEPIIPPPVSRPRSYSDLDAIPDDYD